MFIVFWLENIFPPSEKFNTRIQYWKINYFLLQYIIFQKILDRVTYIYFFFLTSKISYIQTPPNNSIIYPLVPLLLTFTFKISPSTKIPNSLSKHQVPSNQSKFNPNFFFFFQIKQLFLLTRNFVFRVQRNAMAVSFPALPLFFHLAPPFSFYQYHGQGTFLSRSLTSHNVKTSTVFFSSFPSDPRSPDLSPPTLERKVTRDQRSRTPLLRLLPP